MAEMKVYPIKMPAQVIQELRQRAAVDPKNRKPSTLARHFIIEGLKSMGKPTGEKTS